MKDIFFMMTMMTYMVVFTTVESLTDILLSPYTMLFLVGLYSLLYVRPTKKSGPLRRLLRDGRFSFAALTTGSLIHFVLIV